MPDGEITYGDAMHLNRAARRRLAALNKMEHRIPGAEMPIINPKRQQKKLKQKEQDRLNETKM